jgi:hypothetical protein
MCYTVEVITVRLSQDTPLCHVSPAECVRACSRLHNNVINTNAKRRTVQSFYKEVPTQKKIV